jgi:hypothetical protein
MRVFVISINSMAGKALEIRVRCFLGLQALVGANFAPDVYVESN